MIAGPFRGSEAVRAGVLTRGELRGCRYRRLFPDVYVPASLTPTFLVRSQAAFLLVERRGGVAAGYSAAALLGASCEPVDAPVEVLVPTHVKAQPGLLARQGRRGEVETVGGVRVTSRFRTAWDLGRRLPVTEAVVAVDALARAERTGGPPRFPPAALLDRRPSERGARHCLRLDRVVELCDPRAESPMETRMRLALVFGGLRPEVQVVLRDVVGAVVARVDLAFPSARLAIEYDGGGHDDTLDRERDVRTGALGWHTMRFTAADVYRRPGRMVEAVRHQLHLRHAMVIAERLAHR